jgi:hypothetical protein
MDGMNDDDLYGIATPVHPLRTNRPRVRTFLPRDAATMRRPQSEIDADRATNAEDIQRIRDHGQRIDDFLDRLRTKQRNFSPGMEELDGEEVGPTLEHHIQNRQARRVRYLETLQHDNLNELQHAQNVNTALTYQTRRNTVAADQRLSTSRLPLPDDINEMIGQQPALAARRPVVASAPPADTVVQGTVLHAHPIAGEMPGAVEAQAIHMASPVDALPIMGETAVMGI